MPDAVDENHLDGKAPKHGDICHEVDEIFVTNHRAINSDDEDVITEHGDIP
jgi:hypothetical protein